MLGNAFRAEQKRVKDQKRRAKRRGLAANLMVEHWLYLLVAWGQRCAYCGAPADTMDHIIPLCNGGGTTKTNVAPCCSECNTRKGAAVWLPAQTGEAVVKW